MALRRERVEQISKTRSRRKLKPTRPAREFDRDKQLAEMVGFIGAALLF